MNILDLSDELLLIILQKLNIIDVLYSLVGVESKLDRLVRDILFTTSIDLTSISSSNGDDDSTTNPVLDRFYVEILPRIQHNIQRLTLDHFLLSNVLEIGNYSRLRQLTLVNLKFSDAFHLFSAKSSIYNLKDQILELNLTIHDPVNDYKFLTSSRDVFLSIFVTFTKLTHLDFIFGDNSGYESGRFLSLASTIYFSSSITYLNIKLHYFNDCLCLLDGRLSQLKTFIVQIDNIVRTRKTVDNTETLSNLKHFSLITKNSTLEYDTHVLPTLRHMLNLETLILCISTRNNNSFIDGAHLETEIVNRMLRLRNFIFDIVTEYVRMYEEDLPLSDQVLYPLVARRYNVNCYCDYDYGCRSGRCHIYSNPSTMQYTNILTSKFCGGLFPNVREVVLVDRENPFEHEFFIQISRSFPSLKKIDIGFGLPQETKLSNSDQNVENPTIVEFPYLEELNLFSCDADYAAQFLFETKAHLPCLTIVMMDYAVLQRVTNNFTTNAIRVNSSKVKSVLLTSPVKLSLNRDIIQNYFPLARISGSGMYFV